MLSSPHPRLLLYGVLGEATEDMNQLQQPLNLQEERCEVSAYEYSI